MAIRRAQTVNGSRAARPRGGVSESIRILSQSHPWFHQVLPRCSSLPRCSGTLRIRSRTTTSLTIMSHPKSRSWTTERSCTRSNQQMWGRGKMPRVFPSTFHGNAVDLVNIHILTRHRPKSPRVAPRRAVQPAGGGRRSATRPSLRTCPFSSPGRVATDESP